MEPNIHIPKLKLNATEGKYLVGKNYHFFRSKVRPVRVGFIEEELLNGCYKISNTEHKKMLMFNKENNYED